MIQEEKQLLLKDLCARLSYGVKVHTWYNSPIDIECVGIDLYTCIINLNIPNDDNAKVYVDNCKPYLRPLSSMTDEEKEELKTEFFLDIREEDNGMHTETYGYCYVYHNFNEETWDIPYEAIDWLNTRHFDYRGLIEKGLALEAPEGMYKF